MTTEDDFNAALDANPEDWQTRLVYADWLQERGDPRAEGYRALGVLRLWPCPAARARELKFASGEWQWWSDATLRENTPGLAPHILPVPMSRMILRRRKSHAADTRRDAEELFVAVFRKLPTERRAELLAAPPDEQAQKEAEKVASKKPTAKTPKGKKK